MKCALCNSVFPVKNNTARRKVQNPLLSLPPTRQETKRDIPTYFAKPLKARYVDPFAAIYPNVCSVNAVLG